jgi:hypothetical protein
MKGDKMIVVFDPTGRKKAKEKVGAARLSTLQGERIAVIWNGKLGGDVFLNRVSELLIEQFGATGVERIDDRGDLGNAGVSQVVVDRLAATCGAAVIGTGD